MDIVIRDEESKRAYCIVGESLFYALFFNDGSIDTKSWQPIGQELTPYHKDMIEKLKNLHIQLDRYMHRLLIFHFCN